MKKFFRQIKFRLTAIRYILTCRNFILIQGVIKNGESYSRYVIRTDFDSESDVLLMKDAIRKYEAATKCSENASDSPQ